MTVRTLSPRQLEIARLLDDGLTQGQVAERLSISVRTVWHHTAQIRERTGETTTTAAVSHARAHGLGPRTTPSLIPTRETSTTRRRPR